MRYVINIRGPNGAGKTTLVRKMLEHKISDHDFVYQPSKPSKRAGKDCVWPVARCRLPGLVRTVYVQGRYNVMAGGCDREEDMDAIQNNIRRSTNQFKGHILFEGFIVSKSGGRWLEHAQSLPDSIGFLWLFLQPPLDVLVARIKERNGGKEFNVKALASTCQSVENIYQKAKHCYPDCVVDLDYRLAPQELYISFVRAIRGFEQKQG